MPTINLCAYRLRYYLIVITATTRRATLRFRPPTLPMLSDTLRLARCRDGIAKDFAADATPAIMPATAYASMTRAANTPISRIMLASHILSLIGISFAFGARLENHLHSRFICVERARDCLLMACPRTRCRRDDFRREPPPLAVLRLNDDFDAIICGGLPFRAVRQMPAELSPTNILSLSRAASGSRFLASKCSIGSLPCTASDTGLHRPEDGNFAELIFISPLYHFDDNTKCEISDFESKSLCSSTLHYRVSRMAGSDSRMVSIMPTASARCPPERTPTNFCFLIALI